MSCSLFFLHLISTIQKIGIPLEIVLTFLYLLILTVKYTNVKLDYWKLSVSFNVQNNQGLLRPDSQKMIEFYISVLFCNLNTNKFQPSSCTLFLSTDICKICKNFEVDSVFFDMIIVTLALSH